MDWIPRQRSEVWLECGDLQLTGAACQPVAQFIVEAFALDILKNQLRQRGSFACLHWQIHGNRCHHYHSMQKKPYPCSIRVFLIWAVRIRPYGRRAASMMIQTVCGELHGAKDRMLFAWRFCSRFAYGRMPPHGRLER